MLSSRCRFDLLSWYIVCLHPHLNASFFILIFGQIHILLPRSYLLLPQSSFLFFLEKGFQVSMLSIGDFSSIVNRTCSLHRNRDYGCSCSSPARENNILSKKERERKHTQKESQFLGIFGTQRTLERVRAMALVEFLIGQLFRSTCLYCLVSRSDRHSSEIVSFGQWPRYAVYWRSLRRSRSQTNANGNKC